MVCFCHFFFLMKSTTPIFYFINILKYIGLKRKYVILATPFSQKQRRQPLYFILDLLSAQMNIPNTKFSGNSMKHLYHNASTLNIGRTLTY